MIRGFCLFSLHAFSEMIFRIIGVVLIDGLIDESFHGPTFSAYTAKALFGLLGFFLFSVFVFDFACWQPFPSVNSSIKTFSVFKRSVKDLFKHSENDFSLQIVL